MTQTTMAGSHQIKLLDDIIRIVYHHLPLDSLLSLIHVNRAAYAIAVEEPKLILGRLQELPGKQAVLQAMNGHQLVAVLNQRARFCLLNAQLWSNVTALTFNGTVGGHVLHHRNAIIPCAEDGHCLVFNQSSVNLDTAAIATIYDDTNNVHVNTILVAAGARTVFIFEARDQMIVHFGTVIDPFPEEKDVRVTVAKIATWRTDEPVLYCHQQGCRQRWSVSHFPLSSVRTLQDTKQTFGIWHDKT